MGHAYPGAVRDQVPSQRRRQAHGFLLERSQLIAQVQPFGVHDDIQQGNSCACILCGLEVTPRVSDVACFKALAGMD